ncbi:MAG: hypothetical protein U9Q78_07320, partial [Chloroflexota bacterium]|nr:hypothetical protein [Chloroflexota bacterium]
MSNPYVIEGFVEDPRMFFGRRMHLRRLLRHVKKMDCVSVVGPLGIGKSSLLYQLTQQGELKESHLSLYLDLSNPLLQNEPGFLRQVIPELGDRVGRMFVGITMRRLEWTIEILQDEEEKEVLLCLDNFDQFVASPGVTSDFLDELRRLGFERLLSIVVASSRPPEELARRGMIPRALPALFDEQMELGLLPAREADRLIREPALREEVEFSPEVLQLARELGGRHPLYLQLAGYHLFEQVLPEGEIDLEAAREGFAEAAFPHLHELWAGLSEEEREAARYYAAPAYRYPPNVSMRQELIRRGIVERRGGDYRLFSEHFQEVVRRRRQALEEPLPAPEEEIPSPPGEAAEVAEPSEESVAEVAAPPVEEEPVPTEPEPSVAPLAPTEAQPEPPVEPSPQELSALSALGCYVVAITLDFLFIVGVVVARMLLQLPPRR